jgi:dolichyl-phosphate-mannose--protein O-mannosyl transferase
LILKETLLSSLSLSLFVFLLVESKFYLNSEEKTLNSQNGSRQQIVTFISDGSSHNTLWLIRPASHDSDVEYPEEGSCQLAEPIKCFATVRLTHLQTYKNLHSHHFSSPLSQQQEVSAFGEGDGKGDGGDNWRVECKGTYWKRNEQVRFYHIDTQKYLGTTKELQFTQTNCGGRCPILGHLESFARAAKDKMSYFLVPQGIHLHRF